MLEILQYPDPRLNLKAEKITEFDNELKKLAHQMVDTMYAHEGVGLAAIQVNIQKNIFVMDLGSELSDEFICTNLTDKPKIFINPEIITESGKQTGEEGCLSFPGLRIQVTRPLDITLRAQDVDGKEFTAEATGFAAKCIHHEMEHLAGEVFIKDLSRLKLHLALRKLEKNKKATTN